MSVALRSDAMALQASAKTQTTYFCALQLFCFWPCLAGRLQLTPVFAAADDDLASAAEAVELEGRGVGV